MTSGARAGIQLYSQNKAVCIFRDDLSYLERLPALEAYVGVL